MIKKISLALALLLILAFNTAPLGAQSVAEELSPEDLAALAKEPPLTQADIDAFVKIAGAPEGDEEALMKIIAESGLSEERLALMMTKIPLGAMVAAGVPAEALMTGDIPEVMRPSDEELELIKKNMDKLTE